MIFIQDIVLTILLMLMVFYLGTLVYDDFKDMNL